MRSLSRGGEKNRKNGHRGFGQEPSTAFLSGRSGILFRAVEEEVMALEEKDKLAVVTALMGHDRAEVRERQEALFKATNSVIPGFIAIAAFSVAQPSLKWVLLVGQFLLLALYLLVFFTFRQWLANARACLNIRESFIKNPQLLADDLSSTLLRPIQKSDREGIRDDHLWFLFGLTLFSGLVMIVFMLVL
jgi:hypothetical protein